MADEYTTFDGGSVSTTSPAIQDSTQMLIPISLPGQGDGDVHASTNASDGSPIPSRSRTTWVPLHIGDRVTITQGKRAGEVGVVHSIAAHADRVMIVSLPSTSTGKWCCLVPALELELDEEVKTARLSSIVQVRGYRDYLISCPVVVVGAHVLKGCVGRIKDVNRFNGTANIEVDSLLISSNRQESVYLSHLRFWS